MDRAERISLPRGAQLLEPPLEPSELLAEHELLFPDGPGLAHPLPASGRFEIEPEPLEFHEASTGFPQRGHRNHRQWPPRLLNLDAVLAILPRLHAPTIGKGAGNHTD